MKTEFTQLIEDLPLAYRYRQSTEQPGGLIVLMHGVGSNEESLLGLASYIPENHSVALVRSPLCMGPGVYSAFAVNFTASGPVIDVGAAEGSRKKLIAFIPELQRRYEILPERTLIGGFSQGGIMSASLALTEPSCVRGFAILSGRILTEIESLMAPKDDLKHLSALVVHGHADDRLPFYWAERSVAKLEELGIDFQSLAYPMGHEIIREVAADFANWVRRMMSS
ncbi:MAG: phospholipase [Pseudomonadota bacterium]